MNKQQLAAKIWATADTLRSKIEAYEYKDYILGLMFYMFLSQKQESFLFEQGWDESTLSEFDQDEDTVEMVRQSLGYCINYQYLFSSWLRAVQTSQDVALAPFSVESVSKAISAFSRSVHPVHKAIFDNIFDSLSNGLSKLGETTGAQTKALKGIINIIKDIPLNEEQGYDVLGFVYEYLISHFAAGAGKKAGEFYTPHEVSELMAKIVAYHLKNRSEVKIYDPTSGSGSLLITMGKSLEQYKIDRDNIRYFAQELKSNTYNLTRMNLVMRDIAPGNIEVRNADTLESDWPFVETKQEGKVTGMEPVRVDAVVSNPPYSQVWDDTNKINDPRFAGFGVAPKSKADFAFLLHDLYHLDTDGIMTIVLPHGVLFRGGEEGKIRETLVKHNHIDAIIGLPANIFFGTGIPTIIMVLKRKRAERDILMVDASLSFVKEGNKNRLRAQDIQKVVDVVINRSDVPKFSRAVALEEIERNGYNLNLTRYVSSAPESEHWDLAGLTLGQLPVTELQQLHCLQFFPELQHRLFTAVDSGSEDHAEEPSATYLALTDELKTPRNSYDLAAFLKQQFVQANEVQEHKASYLEHVATFLEYFRAQLSSKSLQESVGDIKLLQQLPELKQALFTQLVHPNKSKPLFIVEPYDAYQRLYDCVQVINGDLEILQSEGISALNQVDDLTESQNKNGTLTTKVIGQDGRVLPLSLIKQHCCQEQMAMIAQTEQHIAEIDAEAQSLLESLSEEDKEQYFMGDVLSEEGDAWVKSGLTKVLKNKDVKAELKKLPALNQVLSTASKLFQEQNQLSKSLKVASVELEKQAQKVLQSMSTSEALTLLDSKWLSPLQSQLEALFDHEIDRAAQELAELVVKYQVTPSAIEQEIAKSNQVLSEMLSELTGDSAAMKGINELKQLLQL